MPQTWTDKGATVGTVKYEHNTPILFVVDSSQPRSSALLLEVLSVSLFLTVLDVLSRLPTRGVAAWSPLSVGPFHCLAARHRRIDN